MSTKDHHDFEWNIQQLKNLAVLKELKDPLINPLINNLKILDGVFEGHLKADISREAAHDLTQENIDDLGEYYEKIEEQVTAQFQAIGAKIENLPRKVKELEQSKFETQQIFLA